MKKLFAILLGLSLVLVLSGVAMAATESFTGLVEVTWADDNTDDDVGAVFGGNREAALSVDYKKEFSETVSAGVIGKIVFDAGDDQLIYDQDGDGEYDPGVDDAVATDEVAFDGAGWITVKTDFADITAKTAIAGAAGKDISTGDISENAGVQVDVTAVEGLTLTGIINNEAGTAEALYNFVFKGSYTMEGLTVGGGFSSDAVEGADATTAFDIFGSYALEDLGLTVGGEYASRTSPFLATEKGAAYLVKASFTGVEGLTANFSYEAIDEWYGQTMSDDDYADIDPEDVTLKDMFENLGAEGYVIDINGKYQLTEELSVNGGYQMANWDPEEATEFSAGAEFKVSEELTVTGSVRMTDALDDFGYEMTAMTLGASYALAEGVTLSGEFNSYSGKILGLDFENTGYEVKIAATF